MTLDNFRPTVVAPQERITAQIALKGGSRGSCIGPLEGPLCPYLECLRKVSANPAVRASMNFRP